ncbi:hypothetical protein CYMTET_41465 [Cymbomonas tetramitiformis]|uniref:Uncharacterized protein n=1 Tax=Cymbomonas tetramitiformis TaxID=36881 RepID=A0AAE0F1Z3_9CHLO|nr:hypothetical protein CYMTET_41465 [Cymbomonas tetramitiformis]
MSDSKKGRRSTVQIVEDYLEANEYMKEGDVYLVLKKELYGEEADGEWKDKEYFVNHIIGEKIKQDIANLQLEKLALSDFDNFQRLLGPKFDALETKVFELEAENAELKRKLTTLEELGSSFAVLYPSKTEVQNMIENSK